MANTKISSLTALTGASVATDDKLPIVDTSATTTKRIDVSELVNITGIAASLTAKGFVELATVAETNTGTDATRAITPDGLAGSNLGSAVASFQVVAAGTALTTGDGKFYFRIPVTLNGMDLVSCGAAVFGRSTSGLPSVMLARGRQSSATSAHTFVDMLSTALTIDANEYDSKDAATAHVINTSNDDVATGDLIRVDVDGAGTGTTGLFITMTFRLP